MSAAWTLRVEVGTNAILVWFRYILGIFGVFFQLASRGAAGARAARPWAGS